MQQHGRGADGQRHLHDREESAQAGFGPPVAAKAQVYREANAFCARQGKTVETVNLELTDSGFARPGSVTLEFRCK